MSTETSGALIAGLAQDSSAGVIGAPFETTPAPEKMISSSFFRSVTCWSARRNALLFVGAMARFSRISCWPWVGVRTTSRSGLRLIRAPSVMSRFQASMSESPRSSMPTMLSICGTGSTTMPSSFGFMKKSGFAASCRYSAFFHSTNFHGPLPIGLSFGQSAGVARFVGTLSQICFGARKA